MIYSMYRIDQLCRPAGDHHYRAQVLNLSRAPLTLYNLSQNIMKCCSAAWDVGHPPGDRHTDHFWSFWDKTP